MNRRSSLRFFAFARLTTCALLGLLLAVAVAPGSAAPHSETVTFDPARIVVEPAASATSAGGAARAESAMRVRYPQSIPAPEGAPDLPRVPVWIEIPAGMRATGVKGLAEGLRDLGQAELAPVAPDQRGDEEVSPKATPDPAIYGISAAYPGTWAELGAQSSLRGHWVVGVLVTPVQWNPATKALQAASRVRIELELRPATPAELAEIAPRTRVVAEVEGEFEAGAAKLIHGFIPTTPTESMSEAGSGPAGPGPYQPSFRPTSDGSAVVYVIVTSQALSSEFQRLADWKTQKGSQAVVRTVEWIDQTYPNGVDRAERIRFFVRDAYQNWGTAYVLLGGDSDVIPVRYSQSLFFGGESIPSDLYYGCLDGNWNGDGDSRFGEGDVAGQIADGADLAFEVSIGRAPVSTLSHADTFVDKTLLYEQTPPASTRYPHSILVLAERLFPATHGADVAEQALDLLPPWIRVARLYEESGSYPGSVELTRQAAIDSINAGFGIVHHVGHGYRNTMSVGSGTLNNSDADNLTNGPRNSVVFAINCSSASTDFNAIGERWLKNPNGGSIAYLGTSRLAFISASITYQSEWYSQVWVDSVRSIGWATDTSRLALLPGANVDGVSRWNLMATTLLGDPEADLYTNAVVPIQVSHPANVALNAAPITITVMAQGTPVPGATVTLWKANDAYVRGTTGAGGTVQLPITATGTGPLTVTVHKSYYRAYTGTVNVTGATGPYVFVNATTVDDDNIGSSSGDSDGQADASETIELR
ncbi:MAG TPA: C25 family cysteine peptidase, partial [Candidatus Udaeobacter sp.]|nr:C25 family cysteine peptidase [Candidatus Udaeobacter sp.]